MKLELHTQDFQALPSAMTLPWGLKNDVKNMKMILQNRMCFPDVRKKQNLC